ncbi:transporter substrate-binding domain-containing protein [Pseudonocardia sp. DLS-67]
MPRRPRTRALAALSLLVAATAASACGGAPAPEADPAVSAVTADPALHDQLPEQVRSSGKIVFAIQQHPPYTVLTGDQGSGPNEDLQNAIAAKLGVEAETAVVGGGLGPVLTGLSAHRYDAAMGPVEVTEERGAQYDLVGYLKAGQGYVVDKAKYPGSDILALCGQPISFIQGGTIDRFVANLAEYCAANGQQPVTPLPLADTSKAILAVKSGRAAAAGMGSAAAQHAVTQDDSMSMIPQSVEAGGNYHNSAIVLPKDSGLAPLVVEALRDLMADGTYQSIITKYGLGDGMVDEPTLNPPPEAEA